MQPAIVLGYVDRLDETARELSSRHARRADEKLRNVNKRSCRSMRGFVPVCMSTISLGICGSRIRSTKDCCAAPSTARSSMATSTRCAMC
ncbi:MAG: hypothetical protein MZV70_39390 [Desulfobacterales bacterium]|nr:hypothetical protein [Desulfobacterales bacterium]